MCIVAQIAKEKSTFGLKPAPINDSRSAEKLQENSNLEVK